MEIPVRYAVYTVILSAVGGGLLQKQGDAKDLEKAISEQKVITQTRVVTVVKEIKHADGSSETETTTTDNSTKKEIEKQIAESSKAANKTWLISAGASLDIDRTQAYQVQVQRQILGPVWVGIFGSTRKEAGVSLGVIF